MKMIITRNANSALYRDLQKSIDGQWTHRTVNAAARRLIWLARSGDRLAKSVGNWGGISIQIDGQDVAEFDVSHFWMLACESAREGSDWELVKALTIAAQNPQTYPAAWIATSLPIGARVEGGDTDEDFDAGRVVATEGEQVTVAWDSGTVTTQHFSLLRAEKEGA